MIPRGYQDEGEEKREYQTEGIPQPVISRRLVELSSVHPDPTPRTIHHNPPHPLITPRKLVHLMHFVLSTGTEDHHYFTTSTNSPTHLIIPLIAPLVLSSLGFLTINTVCGRRVGGKRYVWCVWCGCGCGWEGREVGMYLVGRSACEGLWEVR
jgi:hypothetical protein